MATEQRSSLLPWVKKRLKLARPQPAGTGNGEEVEGSAPGLLPPPPLEDLSKPQDRETCPSQIEDLAWRESPEYGLM
jgi:hypothetical protein